MKKNEKQIMTSGYTPHYEDSLKKRKDKMKKEFVDGKLVHTKLEMAAYRKTTNFVIAKLYIEISYLKIEIKAEIFVEKTDTDKTHKVWKSRLAVHKEKEEGQASWGFETGEEPVYYLWINELEDGLTNMKKPAEENIIYIQINNFITKTFISNKTTKETKIIYEIENKIKSIDEYIYLEKSIKDLEKAIEKEKTVETLLAINRAEAAKDREIKKYFQIEEEIELDENGNIIEEAKLDEEGNIVGKILYKEEEEQNIVGEKFHEEEVELDDEGNIIVKEELDDEGNIAEKVIYEEESAAKVKKTEAKEKSSILRIIKNFAEDQPYGNRKYLSAKEKQFYEKYYGKAYEKITYTGLIKEKNKKALIITSYIGYDNIWIEINTVEEEKYQKVMQSIMRRLSNAREGLAENDKSLNWEVDIIEGKFRFYKPLVEIPYGAYNMTNYGERNKIISAIQDFVIYGCGYTNLEFIMEPTKVLWKRENVKAYYEMKKEIQAERKAKSEAAKQRKKDLENNRFNYLEWKRLQEEALDDFPT